MNAHVNCHSGFRYAERPVSFRYAGHLHEINEIQAQWKTETGYTFSVLTDELQQYQLTYDEYWDVWQIKSNSN
jgi:hypothetical protein